MLCDEHMWKETYIYTKSILNINQKSHTKIKRGLQTSTKAHDKETWWSALWFERWAAANISQKRPIHTPKESYIHQKRHTYMYQSIVIREMSCGKFKSKETYIYTKRGLYTSKEAYIHQKRHTYMYQSIMIREMSCDKHTSKEAYIHTKRGLYTSKETYKHVSKHRDSRDELRQTHVQKNP